MPLTPMIFDEGDEEKNPLNEEAPANGTPSAFPLTSS